MENKIQLPRMIVAAPQSGAGKTTITLGLLRGFYRRNKKVQSFKVGPDYIDPAFHGIATGRPGINLDGWLLSGTTNKNLLVYYGKDADISIIEGVMGLYDGIGSEPMKGSTAEMALCLNAPVLLVVDAKGMAASAAALVYGMKHFRDLPIAGVIINRPSSERHYTLMKEAIESQTEVSVFGYLPKLPEITLKSRHLGLVQSSEIADLEEKLDRLAEATESCIDLDRIWDSAQKAVPIEGRGERKNNRNPTGIRIAVARDQAFSFYYHDNIERLREMGAEILFFSPLKDPQLPDCDGVYIGGGYPELFGRELEENRSLRQELGERAEEGIPIYGECGGYMYLHQGLIDLDGKRHRMTGIFAGEAEMMDKLQHFGYGELTATEETCLLPLNARLRVHEFHRSRIVEEGNCVRLQRERSGKMERWTCGKVKKRVFGMYPHLYFADNLEVPETFLHAAAAYRKEREKDV